MAYTPHLTALLPLDVLRLIFEYATAGDKRTGTSLATVSKRVKRWVEPILYSVVNLQRPHTKNLFLRTIRTASTKHTAFFATHVKTLCISYDPSSDDDHTTRIVSSCRGVQSLTFQSISITPRMGTEPHPTQQYTGIVGETTNRSPIFNSAPFLDPASLPTNQPAWVLRKRKALDLRKALAELTPHNVSALLPVSGPECPPHHIEDNHHQSVDLNLHHPPRALPISLNSPLLSRTTHLSIQNKWEDWVSWAGCFEFARLPYLTHLSLDLRAGFSGPTWSSSSSSLSSKTASAHDVGFPGMESRDAERACVLARASQCVLSQCPRLRVCGLRLVFDSHPDRTAAAILAQMPLSKHTLSRHSMRTTTDIHMRTMDDDSSSDDDDYDYDDYSGGGDGRDDGREGEMMIVHMVDPRLVFLWDKDPFQQRDAHSAKEHQMWMKAEEAVKRQSVGLGQFLPVFSA